MGPAEPILTAAALAAAPPFPSALGLSLMRQRLQVAPSCRPPAPLSTLSRALQQRRLVATPGAAAALRSPATSELTCVHAQSSTVQLNGMQTEWSCERMHRSSLIIRPGLCRCLAPCRRRQASAQTREGSAGPAVGRWGMNSIKRRMQRSQHAHKLCAAGGGPLSGIHAPRRPRRPRPHLALDVRAHDEQQGGAEKQAEARHAPQREGVPPLQACNAASRLTMTCALSSSAAVRWQCRQAVGAGLEPGGWSREAQHRAFAPIAASPAQSCAPLVRFMPKIPVTAMCTSKSMSSRSTARLSATWRGETHGQGSAPRQLKMRRGWHHAKRQGLALQLIMVQCPHFGQTQHRQPGQPLTSAFRLASRSRFTRCWGEGGGRDPHRSATRRCDARTGTLYPSPRATGCHRRRHLGVGDPLLQDFEPAERGVDLRVGRRAAPLLSCRPVQAGVPQHAALRPSCMICCLQVPKADPAADASAAASTRACSQ